MARYSGPVCRLCRRERMKLFLKGDRCFKEKCAVERRNFPPGQHGTRRGRRTLGYGLQLREKQKVKRIYGVLESQFRTYFEEADRRKGITGENLLVMLERRLDNVAYSLGFASSRAQARQLVRHGHVLVDGRKITIPSYQVKAGQAVTVKEASRKNPFDPVERRDRARPRRSGVAGAGRRERERQGPAPADARRHQAPDPGAADRRALQPLIG